LVGIVTKGVANTEGEWLGVFECLDDAHAGRDAEQQIAAACDFEMAMCCSEKSANFARQKRG
jgi:hypothetical protein